MHAPHPSPLVHLELHTSNPHEAREFYAHLLRWRSQEIHTAYGSYLALELGSDVGGGIVECGTPRSLWLPYVEVKEITCATARASELGAEVLLEPREGPAGWRSVVAAPAIGEIALWQHKRQRGEGG
jgi:predicted enzyme related to lactoylglutathione lyase